MKSRTVLRVTLLGSFEIYYGSEPVRLKKRQNAKPVQLLQLLLYNRELGITRRSVIEALYGPETEIDTSNNLNATVSQLRRLLRDTILPNESYIYTDIDRYSFQATFPIRVDTEEVLSLRQRASAAADPQERRELLHRLCNLHRGQFLPDLDGGSWAEVARSYYQRIYRESMEELCSILRAAQDHQGILCLADYASKLFPFDEWQAWQYESLLALGRIRDAQELYRDVEKLYLNELDAPLPERMRRKIAGPRREPLMEARSVRAIRDQLDEVGEDGPYCLPFPSFLDAYNLINRMSSATRQPVCLMLCTLRGGGSRSRTDREHFQWAMERLEGSLCQTLRQEDTFTRYSRSQYLAVFIGVEKQDCGAISQRISERFSHGDGSQGFVLECQTVSSGCMQVTGGDNNFLAAPSKNSRASKKLS